jgi:glycosyltransferase involved in cell wall biosynthesis
MAFISVIIPCFNAESWVEETLKSVLHQEISNIEIIVIDDGSTDRSAQIIREKFPFVNLVRTNNQGPSKARNLGTRLSKGDFIQYLDADDLLAPEKLKVQLEVLRKSGADIAYGDWQKLVKTSTGEYAKGGKIEKQLQDPEIDLFTDFWCPPAVYLFRRSIVEKVGGWKENLPIIQDARFVLDCALHGGKFVYCPGIAAYYRIHCADSVSRRDPIAFNRDCLQNAIEIEGGWESHGGIDAERKGALLKVYGYVARSSFEKDESTFESAYYHFRLLDPTYIPEGSTGFKTISKFVGYRRAEAVASHYRWVKSIFR